MSTLLPPSYYTSADVLILAKDLLGKQIVSHVNGQLTSGIIVETEAYRAPEDKGSHAFGNKRTPRTATMFAQGGVSYIYLCYGIHHLLNVVVGDKDVAHAVLIRAIEPVDGLEYIQTRRNQSSLIQCTNGPGKLSAALGITTQLNHQAFYANDSQIHLLDLGQSYKESDIIKSPRVGIAYAQEWALKPWRFRVKDNPYTSLPHQVSYT